MKKIYHKPRVNVEVMTLNQPIAAGCIAGEGDVKLLMALGYFGSDMETCVSYLLADGGVDWNNDGKADDYEYVCYNTNVQTAFLS